MIESKNPSAIRSQKEITQALLVLMHEYPYDEISVKQILLESKLARKTAELLGRENITAIITPEQYFDA